MKKLFLLSVLVAVSSLVMAQTTFPDTVIGGQHYYNGSPTSFMFLPSTTTAANASWVQPKYNNNGYTMPTTLGVGTVSGTPTHRFITSTQFPPTTAAGRDMNACYGPCTSGAQTQLIRLHPAWDSDANPGTFEDTVIQMGYPAYSSGCSGKETQLINYHFIPDKNNSVLLVSYSFVLENLASHDKDYNPYFDMRVMDIQGNILGGNDPYRYYPTDYKTQGNLHLGTSPNWNWPHCRFFVVAEGNGNVGSYIESPLYNPNIYETPVVTNQYTCPAGCAPDAQASNIPVLTYAPTIVAFDLTEQAENHQPVILQIRVRSCWATYHWAYCYFTAKMVPAELKVDYCTGDPAVHLSVPWGFDAQSYRWYNGADENNCHYASEVEELAGYPYSFYVEPDPANPYWRCEATSSTGVPFKYEATVKYIDLRPSFTVTPAVDSCKYNIRLTNTSQIVVFTPDGQGGVDSAFQDLQANPNQCHWDFGDGTTTTGFKPCHTYTTPGPHNISFYVTDMDNICQSDTVVQQIAFDPDNVAIHYDTDTVSTCESKLPYRYKPEIFGTNELTTWNLSAVGDHNVNYSNALPEYHIRSNNGCDSIVKVRFDVLTPTVVIEQVGEDFCDSAHTVLQAFVSNADEDAIRYEWTFMDSVMGRTEILEAISDGTYSVSIVDGNTDCAATNLYKIDPCVPNIFIPNCITPTDDRSDMLQNDYVYLDQFVLRFITDIKFAVYARNGQQVYYYEGKKNAASVFEPTPQFENLPTEMSNRLVLWDGRSGRRIVTGVYTYTLWIVSGKQQYLYKGTITVL